MPRNIVSKDELRDLVQQRINNSDELDGDCREVIVNSICWHEPDESGSNWDIHSLRNAAGCEDVARVIASEFKEQYNIEDE